MTTSLAEALRQAVAQKSRGGFVRVLGRVADAMAELGQGVNAGILTPDAWQAEMANLLLVGHLAAYAEGRGVKPKQLTAEEDALVGRIVAEQIPYLDGFATQIDETGWQPAMEARARMYAAAMRQSYERARAGRLELPAYPGDGSSECLTNCRCGWRIVWLDKEKGNADCYWTLGRVEHCETCTSRARRWAPLKVRGWEVVR